MEARPGLQIGHDFPGNIYRRIQQALIRLKNRGVLLVLLSKNNPNDVEEAFNALPDMPLRLDDFTAIRPPSFSARARPRTCGRETRHRCPER